MLIVAKDGTGDFITVQAAVDAAISTDRTPQIILIRSGEYRERVVLDRDNLRIIGENSANTVITWSACAHDQDDKRYSPDDPIDFVEKLSNHIHSPLE